MNHSDNYYSVLDVETTGFSARRHDRVIEIALVSMNSKAEITDEYCTLINPCRDVGPTSIHGIYGRDVMSAPKFEDIVGDLVSRIKGTVIVAHNASFDLGFLSAEFSRAGSPLPRINYVCTLQAAGLYDSNITSRKLESLCEYFGIVLPQAHSALDDARATSELLKLFILKKRQGVPITHSLPIRPYPGEGGIWPSVDPSGLVRRRGDADRSFSEPEANFMNWLVSRLPHDAADPINLQDYLCVLDRAIEDRRLTQIESQQLLEVALEWGLNQSQVEMAHEKYLQDMVTSALEDEVLSDFELKDLKTVAQLLSVPEINLESMIRKSRAEASLENGLRSGIDLADDLSNLTICFTGQLLATLNGRVISREFAQTIARERGMIVKANVSRNLDFLVCADPDSMSGKATKAREMGVRVITESQFWRIMRVQVR
jgi:DNA polymerase-3 subunit epsilon